MGNGSSASVSAWAARAGGDIESLDAAARSVLGEPLDAVVERDAIHAALDPAESVASRDSVGGPAPDAVAAQLDEATATLAADRSALADKRQTQADAEQALASEVSAYA
jgi:argininosuccinate lyase